MSQKWGVRAAVRKAQPSASDVHINTPLTNISVAYIQDQNNYIAEKVFPRVPVQKQSDLFWIFNKNDFMRDEAKLRAGGTESAGGGFSLTTGSYAAQVRAFHKDIDDQTRANADSLLALDTVATQWVTQKLLLSTERLWFNSFFTTGIWGTDITPTNLWSSTLGTPREDIDVGKGVIASTTGITPNTLVVTDKVFYALRSNAEIRDQFKYTSADSIDEVMMARFFGIDRLLRSRAVVATNAEGGTDNTNYITGSNSALLCYSAAGPSLMQPTAGYTFVWTGFTGSVQGARMKRFRMEPIESDRIEGEYAVAQKVVAPSLGYFLNGVA